MSTVQIKGREGFRRGVTEGDITPRAMLCATFGTLAAACAVGCPLDSVRRLAADTDRSCNRCFRTRLQRRTLSAVARRTWRCRGVCVLRLCACLALHIMQTGEITGNVAAASAAVGLMGCNVLIVNNYRIWRMTVRRENAPLWCALPCRRHCLILARNCRRLADCTRQGQRSSGYFS